MIGPAYGLRPRAGQGCPERGCDRREHRAVTAAQRRPWKRGRRKFEVRSLKGEKQDGESLNHRSRVGRSVERCWRWDNVSNSKAAKVKKAAWRRRSRDRPPSEDRTSGRIYSTEGIVTFRRHVASGRSGKVVRSVESDRQVTRGA